MGDKRGDTGFFVRISERKRPLGRSGFRWKNNIKMNLKELE
jgi:hypothetical protein